MIFTFIIVLITATIAGILFWTNWPAGLLFCVLIWLMVRYVERQPTPGPAAACFRRGIYHTDDC